MLIHSHRYTSTEPTHHFWEIQVHIALQLHATRSLSIVVAVVHPDHNCRAVGVNFTQCLHSSGWVITNTQISFPSFGDSISGLCRLIIAVHSDTEEKCSPIEIITPPQLPPRPIARHIWALFNRPEHAVSYSKNDKSFNNHAVNDNCLQPLGASIPSDTQQTACPDGVRVDYYLHRHDNNPANLVGSAVICIDGLCPPFNPIANTNVFGHYFGIEYRWEGSTYIRAISPFEFVSCFRLSNKLTYALSHPLNAFCLDAAVSALTSAQIFDAILDRCIQIHQRNFDIFEANQYAAPAACIQTFLSRAVGIRLPLPDQWAKAYLNDAETVAIVRFVKNPGTITTKNLDAAKLNATYCTALRQSQIILNNGILILQEPIAGSKFYARLQLVPSHFRSIIFVAFHSNPLGAHFNATRTLHRIWLRLLAGHVAVHHSNVQGLPWMRTRKPYLRQISQACVLLPHQGPNHGPPH
jgi:hypothetical protein